MTIQVIYTPETDHFKLDEFGINYKRSIGDTKLDELRKNYQKLRDQITLPKKVGIVTFNQSFKQESKRLLDDIDDPKVPYMPLAILEQILKLKDTDFSDPLEVNYFIRTVDRIVSHPAILSDPRLFKRDLIYASSLPSIQSVIKAITRADKTDRNHDYSRSIDKLRNLVSFESIQGIKEEVESRFQQNQVSKKFPLFYFTPNYPIELFSVSLIEAIDEPEFLKGIMGYIKSGYESLGDKEIPENIQKELDKFKQDLFCQTKRINSIEELLDELPEPKTLITDLYLADKFPQLSQIGFNATEFQLST